MKAKVKATGEIVEVDVKKNVRGIYSASNGNHYWDVDLDFNISAPEKAVIEGYVCRDKDWDEEYNTNLWLGIYKPIRKEKWWAASKAALVPISADLFPSITWESNPQRVKIEITLIDEKQ